MNAVRLRKKPTPRAGYGGKMLKETTKDLSSVPPNTAIWDWFGGGAVWKLSDFSGLASFLVPRFHQRYEDLPNHTAVRIKLYPLTGFSVLVWC